MLNTQRYGYLAQLQRLAAMTNTKRKGNTMKLRKVGNNVTELVLTDGSQVLVSYETPVAACVNGDWFRTSKKWSSTTSKHINKWLGGMSTDEKPQEFFDELLKIG